MKKPQKQAPLNDEEIAKLYVEASSDMPSQSLDSAILAAAHKAVQAKPKATQPTSAQPKRNFLQHWQLPISIAATVVVSFSLVTFMQQEKPDLVLPSAENQAAAAVADATTVAKQSTNNNELVVAPTASVQTLPEAQEKFKVQADMRDKTASVAISSSTINEAQLNKKTVEKATDKALESTQSNRAKPFADKVATHAAPKAASPATPMSQTIEVPEGPQADSETAMATTAPIESNADADAEVVAGAANNGATTEEKVVLARKPSNNSAIAENDENLPENWLKNIEDLRNKGELDAARKSLKGFKLRYPNYVLPKQLIEFGK